MTNRPTSLEENPLCWAFLYPKDGFDLDCHVIPENDIVMHEVSKDCWCSPVDDLEANDIVWMHNSKDGREAYDEGIRRLN